MKKFLSLFLTVTLMLSIVVTPVSAATVVTGTNGKTIYLSTKALAADDGEVTETEITSVNAGDDFFIQVNFCGNPTDLADSVQSYALIFQYDNAKMTAEDIVDKLTSPTANCSFTANSVLATWASEKGIKSGTKIKADGTLYYIYFTAKTALTAEDLTAFTVVSEANSKHSFMADQADKEFTLVQAPALSVTVDNETIYTSNTADEVKNHITVNHIDATGASSLLEASDLTVTLPQDMATAGDKTFTVTSASTGLSATFTATVTLDELSSIAITTAPTKTEYVSGETFDKTGMVVTATYASGKTKDVANDCTVDTTTALKTTNNEVTVTYGEETAKQAITVNQKSVTVPTAVQSSFVYNGQVQTLELTNFNESIMTVTGNTGTNVNSYTATVSLKDTTETKWATEFDGEISWTITRATPTADLFTFTPPENLAYDGKSKEAEVTSEAEGMGKITLSYSKDDGVTYSNDAPTAVGTYKVKIDVAEGDNYTAASNITNDSWKFEITKATPSYTAPTAKTGLEYTGLEQALIEAGSVTSAGAQMEYKLGDSGSYGTTIPKATNAGTYTVYYKVDGGDNYADVDEQQLDVTIAPKKLTKPAVDSTKTYTYSGEAQTVALKDFDESTMIVSGNTQTDASTQYKAVVSLKDATNYTWADGSTESVELPWTIAPKTLSVNDGTLAATKVFDNTTGAPTPTGALGLTGVCGSDVVSVTYTSVGAYADKNVEGNKSITLSGLALDGAAKANYTLGNVSEYTFTKASITVLSVTKPTADTTSYTYDGTEKTYTLGTVTDSEWYTVTNNTRTNAGSQKVSVALKDETNTQWADATAADLEFTFAIEKAPSTGISASPVTKTLISSNIYQTQQNTTYDLSALSFTGVTDPCTMGEVTYAAATSGTSEYITVTGVTGKTVNLSYTPQATTVTNGKFVIKVSCDNYADFTIEVPVEFKDKTDVSDKMTLTVPENLVYGTTYEIVGKLNNVATTFEYSYRKSGTSDAYTNGLPANAGTYEIVASYNDDVVENDIPGHIGSTTATLSIAPRPVTLTWTDSTGFTYDKTQKSVTAEVSNKVGTDAVSVLTYTDNEKTDAGTYTAMATALTGTASTNYTLTGGTNLSKSWSIAAKPLTEAMVSLANETLGYTGEEQTDTVTVTDGSALTEDTDYTVSGNKGTDAKTYTVTVTGTGNYTGTITKTFQITKAQQTALTVSTTSATFGTPLTLAVSGGSTNGAVTYAVANGTGSATVSGNTLTPTKAGTVTVTATMAGNDNYEAVSSSATTVTIAKAAAPTVTGISFNVYFGNTDTQPYGASSFTMPADAGTVTIKGVSSATGDVLANAPTTSGFALKSGLTSASVKDNAASWTVTLESENYADATATVTVNVVNVTFAVGNAAATADNAITVNSDKLTYGSKWSDIVSKANNFTATVNGTSDNTQSSFKLYIGDSEMNGNVIPDVKTYTVKVIYSGTIGDKEYSNLEVASRSVSITKAAAAVTAPTARTLTYTGEAQALVNAGATSDGTLKYCLEQSGTYSTAIPTGTNAGSYTVWYMVEGDDNHNSSTPASVAVTIAPKSISDANVTLGQDTLPFNGGAQTVSVSSVVLGGKTLTEGTDYTVSGTQQTAVGAYTVTVAGKGNYTGTATKAWSITAKPIAESDFTFTLDDQTYTGSAIEPAVTTTLTPDDYTVAYSNNTNAGTATITITGRGNYGGTVTKTFNIVKAERKLSVEPNGPITLYRNGTATLNLTFDNADNSAAVAYALSGDTAAVVQKGNVFTAKTSGTLTVKVTIAETDNYKASEQTVTLTVISQPTLTLSVTEQSGVKAVADGTTVTLTGTVDTALSLANLTYTVSGYTVDKSADGTTLTVRDGDNIVGEYTVVDKTVVAPANVKIDVEEKAEADQSKLVDTTNKTEKEKEAVTTVTESEQTKIEGVAEAAAQAIVDAAKQAEAKLTAEQKAQLGDYTIEAKVVVAITPRAIDFTTDTEHKSMTLDVTPEIKLMAKGNGDPIDLGEEEVETLSTKVLVQVEIPEGFNPTVAKHHLEGGGIEWLPVTIVEGPPRLAQWYQDSFSEVELAEVDDIVVGYDFLASGESVTYNLKSLNTELPVPTGSGTFNGWTFTYEGTTYTTKVVTHELLQALDAGEEPTASFTQESRPDRHGGSTAKTYEISVDKAKNGKVTVSADKAKKGDTVTITVKPDKGFTLETLTVLDKKGNEITVKDLGNNRYSFKMPEGKVTVEATFMEDNTMLNFFVDVKANDYYYDAVLWAALEGITSGTDTVHFSPDLSCTRGQTVTFLWRAAGCPEPVSTVNPFTDVDADTYYYKAILWAVDQGITNGTSATTFAPNATVNRGQVVTFLFRAAKAVADKTSVQFADVDSTAYYADAIAWAVANGITNGTSDTTFSPDANCTRSQIVTFLYRYFAK